ncbi:Endothelial differentiation- factor 1 [Thoreauomyces humboldtii]|nr:Endothelial differentiation- factor 1 [Thoreauomyces humboldtii]
MSDSWDNVTVIRKRPETTKAAKTSSAINSALRTGGTVSSEKKSAINQNHVGIDAGKAFKIDQETEVEKPGILGRLIPSISDFTVERVSLGLAQTISKARQAKGLTQKDLATKINEKPQVIAEYESSRAANPNQQLLAKMERVLGVKLRGKDIGQPLAGRGGDKK